MEEEPTTKNVSSVSTVLICSLALFLLRPEFDIDTSLAAAVIATTIIICLEIEHTHRGGSGTSKPSSRKERQVYPTCISKCDILDAAAAAVRAATVPFPPSYSSPSYPSPSLSLLRQGSRNRREEGERGKSDTAV